jgi:DNA-binding LacI/PurR family transcriptional regulator
VLPGDYTQASGYEAAKALFASGERPTALFAANDLMALGAMGAAREKGLIAGVDFALCGFDDIEVAAYGYISLTTVSYSRKEGGAIARELLQQRCTDPTRTPKVVKVRPRLLVRNTSCACNEETIVVDSDLR